MALPVEPAGEVVELGIDDLRVSARALLRHRPGEPANAADHRRAC
jgi:hypothetical protein